ncbi:cyclophilin-like fold protein [Treponema zioleckii]|uniref:cyclophilin-like fold protein n=1 Tax=Treponema zioleckii TaxID=331680 RepID=UPI00168A5D6F|nr:cyclophilin-like fold protein [Treponema zioleckii]
MKKLRLLKSVFVIFSVSLFFQSCSRSEFKITDDNKITARIKNIENNQKVEFSTNDIYKINGIYFVDLPEIVNADKTQFKKENEINSGDIFLDTSNRLVMFLDNESYNVMKGTKLGTIKKPEDFAKAIEVKDRIVSLN